VLASAEAPVDYEQELVERMLDFRWDPLGCALFSFPWGEDELAGDQLRKFQIEFLEELGRHLQNPATRFDVFRKAFSSGHGIGKSALIGITVHWGSSTCLDCKVLVLANTGDQLKTKTQPEMAKWFRLAINKEWFEVNVTSIKANDAESAATWRTDFVTWSEDNPQASAGAHNKGKRLIIIMDEAGEIPDSIYKVIEGALTDANTEIIWLLFSQCTKSDGAFYEACFGNQRHRWRPAIIDSRTVEGINVKEIEESIALYGEDSDHVRVRYRGLFPVAGGGKFIDLQMVNEAKKRRAVALPHDPLVAGVDFAWGGIDENVIRFRKGSDARSIPPVRVKGEFTRDPAVMVGKIADVLSKSYNGEKVAMMFADGSGVGGNAGAVVAGVRALGHSNIQEVNFGHDAIDQAHYAYRRDEMWGKMKEWLRSSGAIDDDPGLAADLQKPVLVSDPKQRIKLEPKDKMKERLRKAGQDSSSPDDGDALALTFANPVAVKKQDASRMRAPRRSAWN
jgi:hypothetical protein